MDNNSNPSAHPPENQPDNGVLDGVVSESVRRASRDKYKTLDFAEFWQLTQIKAEQHPEIRDWSIPRKAKWAQATCKNEAGSHVRKLAREKTDSLQDVTRHRELASECTYARNPAAIYQENRDNDQLRRNLDELSDPERTAVWKRFAERKPPREIAEEMNITVRHARYLVASGLIKLRKMYGVKPKEDEK